MKSVQVSDYMTRKLITFTPSTPLFEAMNTMLAERISGAPVVDEGGQLIGVLSEIDFLEEVLKRSSVSASASCGRLPGPSTSTASGACWSTWSCRR